MAVTEAKIVNYSEMSDVPSFDITDNKFEDLHRLLLLAESLKERCDYIENKIDNKKYSGIINLFVVVFFGVTVFYLNSSSIAEYIKETFGIWHYFFIIIPSLAIGISLGMLIASFREINQLKKDLNTEKFALAEVLQILRETSDVIAREEDWSAMRRAELRIRLSRFNLKEKASS